jgi:hypothetical protein
MANEEEVTHAVDLIFFTRTHLLPKYELHVVLFLIHFNYSFWLLNFSLLDIIVRYSKNMYLYS